jgi:hypothetical protein
MEARVMTQVKKWVCFIRGVGSVMSFVIERAEEMVREA